MAALFRIRRRAAARAALLTVLLIPIVSAAGDDARIAGAHLDNPLLAAPGVTGGSLAAFSNPAAWADNDRAEAVFRWTDHEGGDGLEDWGFSWGRRIGMAVRRRVYDLETGRPHATDWQLGLTTGGRRAMAGLAYRWPGHCSGGFERERAAVAGAIYRPGRAVSLGLSGAVSLESDAALAGGDIGLRPFGTPLLTVYGDYSLREGRRLESGLWGLGAELRPAPGIRCGLKYHEGIAGEDPGFTIQLGLTFVGFGLRSAFAYDGDGGLESRSYALRLSPPEAPLPPLDPPVFGRPDGGGKAVRFDLQGRRLTYRRHRWLDERSIAWLPLARQLDDMARRPDVAAVALNLAGFSARPSLAWELRRSLRKLREAGKKVYIHADRLGMLGLWTASVADRLTIDPQGRLTLPGLNADRTYMKEMLARLGVGFEALQLFPHKTAVEILSRDDMSTADREQLTRMLDVVYERLRADVCAGRGISPEEFDRIVDERVMVLAADAVECGLVDGAARWDDLPRQLESLGEGLAAAEPDGRSLRRHNAERWGTPPRIEVVYAVGGCEMDSGIKGRAVSARLRELTSDRDLAAVVVRIDSPGGDPLPSDLVAGAVSGLKEAGVPVVISQGDVAASGGYWLGATGSRILTTPLTVTGSIGVISGWAWDDGLGGRIGLNPDGVSRGAHADLFRRTRLPLLGLSLPARGLGPGERELARTRIMGIYESFLDVVAAGRGLDRRRVERLAAGRVWMGPDAIAGDLCDAEGGLLEALAAARELAGIPAGEEIEITEYPPLPPFKLPRLPLLPGPPASGAAAEPAPADPLRSLLGGAEALLLELVAAEPGRPLTLLPPGNLPTGWDFAD